MTSVLTTRPDYLQAIGGIDAEWATIEHGMFLLFQALMGVDAARAHAVFSQLTNHRLRRDVLIGVARSVLGASEDFQALRHLDKQIERVALKRNIIAHAAWGIRGTEVVLLDQRHDWRPVPVPLSELIELQMAIRSVYYDLIQLLKVLRRRFPVDGTLPPAAPADPVTL